MSIDDLEKLKNIIDFRCMVIRDSMVSKVKSQILTGVK